MSLRYRFIDFASIADETELLRAIVPPASPMQALALIFAQPLTPFKNVFLHLRKIGAQTLLVQESVRDPDFLAEHEAFYSKQHRVISRLCLRLHTFAAAVPVPPAGEAIDARGVLEFLDALAEPNRYLGFVTIRPLRHAPIGASILLPAHPGDVTCHESFPVHIAGKDFQICGTPYLQQDNAVGACAQASIWIALRTQMKRVGNTAYNPADLTRAATRYMALDRVFPGRQGLIIEQMLEAIRSSGHDPLTLTCDVTPPNVTTTAAQVIEQVLPYVESGLPVIATLFPPGGGHAVVCIGRQLAAHPISDTGRVMAPLGIEYRVASAWVQALVIHNDNTGPYLPLESGDAHGAAYCLEHAKNLIVPLPEAVHMTAKEAEQSALKALAFTCILLSQYDTSKPMRLTPEGEIVLRTFLVRRHAFRRWALQDEELDPALRDLYRTMEMPRLAWFVELHAKSLFDPRNPNNCSRIGEIVLDASADTLHGDVTLAARLSGHVMPSYSVPQGLLVSEYGSNVVMLSSGALGKSLPTPWE